MQNGKKRRFQLAAEFVASVKGQTLLCNRVAFFDFREKVRVYIHLNQQYICI